MIIYIYVTHILPRGYFHAKNEMIAVNIVEVIERTQIHQQRQTARQSDGQIDVQGETCIPP